MLFKLNDVHRCTSKILNTVLKTNIIHFFIYSFITKEPNGIWEVKHKIFPGFSLSISFLYLFSLKSKFSNDISLRSQDVYLHLQGLLHPLYICRKAKCTSSLNHGTKKSKKSWTSFWLALRSCTHPKIILLWPNG